MSTYGGVLGTVNSIRRGAWKAGGVILLAMGAGSAAVAIVGLIFVGGGVAFLPLALPPLAAGYAVTRATRLARVFAVSVAVLYGVVVAYVATYPLRGLPPPPGQSASIDPGSLLVAAVFLTAALLILVGSARREASGR